MNLKERFICFFIWGRYSSVHVHESRACRKYYYY